MPVFKNNCRNRNNTPSTVLLESFSRYRRAFSRARAMRFWGARIREGAIALVMTAPLAIPSITHAQLFPASIDLATLDGTSGFRIGTPGFETDGLGLVSSAGDVNGDGFDDLIVGAYSYGAINGDSYVLFGSNTPFAADIDPTTLDGTNGFVLFNQANDFDFSGSSISGAGDVNGDGFDDLVIGARYANNYAGESFVVLGSNTPAASVDLTTLNGTNGFVINGINAGDESGNSVSGAGDVNGDGIDDLIIGAGGADPGGRSNAGESYVVFGNSTSPGPSFDLSTLNGTNGFVINGVNASDLSGQSAASGIGDFNGDGIDDLGIGASAADPNGENLAGESYVVFGNNTSSGSSLDLSTLDGTNGFVLSGLDSGDRSGFSVSGAGDVNGDGVDDLIVGAFRADPGGDSDAGESYVVFGNSNTVAALFDLSTLDGTNGFVLEGINAGDQSGRSVSGAGDVNGDGIDDLIIGAYRADDSNGDIDAGEGYVVFGNTSFGSSFDLSTLDGTNGFTLLNSTNSMGFGFAQTLTGFSVSDAGDVNGDGIDDLIIGAPGTLQGGASFVVFGQAVPEPSSGLLAFGGLLAWLTRRRRG